MDSFGAIVLAGGGATRLGGVLKGAIRIGGIRMLDRVLSALDLAAPVVVVGPADLDVPAGIARVQEDPPGGGPVAGLGAALDNELLRATDMIAVVAGDLPLLASADLQRLRQALMSSDDDGAVYVDAGGRPQWLCGVWRTAVLGSRLSAFAAERGGLANGSLRALLGALRFVEVGTGDTEIGAGGRVLPPYFDCDTDDDIRLAEEWLRR